MLRLESSLWLAVAFVMSASVAHAHPTVSEPGARVHDGFFLRINSGPEYAHLSKDLKYTLSAAEIAIGRSVTRNLALYVEVKSGVVLDKRDVVQDPDAQAPMFMDVRLGAGYYFNNNVHINVAVGRGFYSTGRVDREHCWMFCDGEDYREVRQKFEFTSINLAAGKEWWVSDNWGLGVAANVTIPVFDGGGLNKPGVMAGVRFTATYN